jgi:exopolyphosphatase/guanosine-5'-triphosphate,3'-diphosphate pyrophosphatase
VGASEEGGDVYAAIDLGTHNCRMLIARPDGSTRFRIIDAFSRTVRLGEGLDITGRLNNRAMDRAVEALAVCAERMRRARVSRVRAIATEPCRRAANSGAFLARVAAETGLDLEPILPHEEAALTLAGCSAVLDGGCKHVLLFDIGGGSTEIVWVERQEPLRWTPLAMASIPIGVVSCAERYGGDRVSPEDYLSMRTTVERALQSFDDEHRIGDSIRQGGVQMVGSSGTVTTLAAVHLSLRHYDRHRVDGLVLSFDDIARVAAWLTDSDYASRAAVPCIGRERADLVVAGCAILGAICHRWPVGQLTVADRGIREGLLLQMIAQGPVDLAASKPCPG